MHPVTFPPSAGELPKILNGLPVALAAVTLEARPRIIFVNETFTHLFGYTVADIPTVESFAMKAYPDPDYRRTTMDAWDKAVRQAVASRARVESMEFRVATQQSETKDCLVSAVVLDQFLLVSAVDVTARRRAEGEARSAQEQIERAAYEVTENIPAGTYTMLLPPGGGMAHFSFMSTRFLEICGLDRKAAAEDPLNAFACVHPDDREAWIRKNAECFAQKIPFSEECRIISQGVERWILAESFPRDKPDGSVVWEGVLTDITARKKTEQALRQTTQRMQLAAAAAGIGFWSRDLASKTEEWDDQMLHIYGVRREDFDGVWEPHVHPDDLAEVQRLTRQAIRTGAAGQYQYRIVRPDGEVRHLRGLSTAIRDAKGHAVSEIGVNFDITEQKQAEAALAAARQREKETEKQQRLLLESKLKTSLTASAIAHEINQPLSRILLISELVLGGTPGLNRQCKKLAPLLKELGTEASRVVATIGKMKSLLRNVETRHHRINLVDVAEDALLYSKPLFKRHRVQVSFEPPTRACRIAGDAEQIQIALNNLLRNAVEALAAQRTRRPRKIAVEIRNQRGATHIVIGDSGPGLTEKESRRLLLQSTKPEGSGLGLFLAATAAENHGGRLEIDHSHLGGAEFRLIFPKKL